MKKKFFFLFVIISLLSFYACEEEVVIIDSVEVETVNENRFSRTIPNCQVGLYAGMNCSEFIEFINESEAHLLLGGNDVLESGKYTIVEGEISIILDRQSSHQMTFEIIDSLNIMNMEDNAIWSRD